MKQQYYLDNAGTTWPKPEVVYTAMDQLFRQYGVNPGRAAHEMAVEAEKIIVETRRMLAAFFNFKGEWNRVVFTQNATDSLNMVMFGLLGSGDHVISTRMEHNSVIRPLNHLERDRGVKVTQVGRDSQGYIDPDDIRRAIDTNTKLVVVNHASNVLGSVQDVKAVGDICRDSDALFVIDTCQSAGVLPIDMEELGIDVLTFTGHKGLFGPMGIGGMIVGEHVDIPAHRVGGTGVDSITEFQPEIYPNHLEAGTINFPGVAGLNAAQKWFAALGAERSGDGETKLSHGDACRAALEHIASRELAHVNHLASAFEAMDGVTVYGPKGNGPRVSTLSINLNNLPADQVGAMLDADYYVCVRAGLHCAPQVHIDEGTVEQKGSIRFSPGYFTDDEDLEQAVTGVSELAEIPVRA